MWKNVKILLKIFNVSLEKQSEKLLSEKNEHFSDNCDLIFVDL